MGQYEGEQERDSERKFHRERQFRAIKGQKKKQRAAGNTEKTKEEAKMAKDDSPK